MEWSQLQEKVYYEDGSWRDIVIDNFSIEEWGKWVTFVNDHFKVNWYNPLKEEREDKINFEFIKESWLPQVDLGSCAEVDIGGLLVKVHFFDTNEFENDFDPIEVNTQEVHQVLISYLKELSKLLKKEVRITPEDWHEFTLSSIEQND